MLLSFIYLEKKKIKLILTIVARKEKVINFALIFMKSYIENFYGLHQIPYNNICN